MTELGEPLGLAGYGGVACVPSTGPNSEFELPQGGECGSPLKATPAMSSIGTNSDDQSVTSSIGTNSDNQSAMQDDHEENEEVQSVYQGAFDSMDALEEALPIRRGLSQFYNGKSKSFTNLDNLPFSVQETAKPENAYSKRRRNLLAFNHARERNDGGRISKRPLSSRSSQLALAVAMSSSQSISSSSVPRSPPRQLSMHPPTQHNI